MGKQNNDMALIGGIHQGHMHITIMYYYITIMYMHVEVN